ncbi:hypothetical protein A3L08_03985 [Thermococcus pacificus]|uniref:Aminoacyl-tRNA synthetase class II (D/K/N) domain-containing protein n=1 Tax=Thermococcus pacificus TaxID=71998 RepID=A0A218P6Y3_9EURY|nr:hypothetical protein A3L08_03985 [Thermococcus pacificus]
MGVYGGLRNGPRLQQDDASPEEVSFKPYLEVAKAGLLRPSAGAGIGVERLVRYIMGAKHIAEIQPFSRILGIPPVI